MVCISGTKLFQPKSLIKKKRHWLRWVVCYTLLVSLTLRANPAILDSVPSFISSATTQLESLGDEPSENWWIYPELQPRQVYSAPEIDWSKFWTVFKNHVMWSLEGWNPVSEEWEFANDSLTVETTAVGDNGRKLNLVFDAPAPITTDYRLTLAIDYKVKQYAYRVDKYTYNLSFEVHGETFNVSYNFSDIVSIPGVVITHGVKDVEGHDYFWFRARRNTVPSGYHIELDPAYTVFSGSWIIAATASQRNLVRQSNGTLWCAFVESTNDVHVAWSDDDGVTWTNYEVWAAQFSFSPSIAVDSNDVVHLVFYSLKNDADDYQLEYTNSSDWTTIVQIRNEDKEHSYPSIAVDSNDNLHVVYHKNEEGISNWDQLAYINSTDNGGSWGTEQILTNEVDPFDWNWYPSIAINSTDSIHVVFMCTDHYLEKDDILHIQSDDYGNTWTDWESDPIYQDDTYDQRFPCIAIDDNDKLHVVWYGVSQNTNDQIGYSHNDSSGWSTVEWVTWDASIDYQSPSISVNDNDYIHTAIRVANTRLNHSVNDTTSWTMNTILTGNYYSPNMICAQYPIINGAKTNRPKTGYALICAFSFDNITYYASNDLAWEVPPIDTSYTSYYPINHTSDFCPCCIPLSATIYNLNGSLMNLTFYSNLSMNYWDWIYLGDEGATYANVTNGTYEYTVCAFNKYNYTYYWNFSVDDGTNTLNSDIFWFTTAANQSLCNETSFSNFTGDGIIMDESWLIGVIIIFSVFGMIAFIKQKRYHL